MDIGAGNNQSEDNEKIKVINEKKSYLKLKILIIILLIPLLVSIAYHPAKFKQNPIESYLNSGIEVTDFLIQFIIKFLGNLLKLIINLFNNSQIISLSNTGNIKYLYL
ncbi:MAG: hypothetical protein BTN85_0701 [Candidatus Methanohalarchaeum thermophilum]|uniref:Uncharacterized protein n=1 Tax=Methanohalarchaeum thermophilum TaxID=1903181 RepID=A0A1Q6DV32_METT1|nr:MAG: hypothetical protein BTN85_0701 [Candidatus Methanohalarchaeum thermophilum]